MDTREHISLLPIAVEDIRFVKLQQWKVVYYVLLLHGAIAGFYSLVWDSNNSIDVSGECLLIISSLLIAGIGMRILFDLQGSLVKFRVRLNKIYIGIRKSENDFLDVWGEIEENKEKFLYQAPLFLISFSIIMWASAFFVKFLVDRNYGYWYLYVLGYVGYFALLYLYSDYKLKKHK